MKKGFIYQYSIRPPYEPFTFKKTDSVLEAEELIRIELKDPNFSFSDENAFCFDMGYKFGLIDGGG